MQERKYALKNLATIKEALDNFEICIPNIPNQKLNKLQINKQINPINRFDKELKNQPTRKHEIPQLNLILKQQNVTKLIKLNKFKHYTIKQNLKKTIFNNAVLKKNKKIKNFNLNYNINIILKNLIIQNFEFFPVHLIINIKYQYVYTAQKYNLKIKDISFNKITHEHIKFLIYT